MVIRSETPSQIQKKEIYIPNLVVQGPTIHCEILGGARPNTSRWAQIHHTNCMHSGTRIQNPAMNDTTTSAASMEHSCQKTKSNVGVSNQVRLVQLVITASTIDNTFSIDKLLTISEMHQLIQRSR